MLTRNSIEHTILNGVTPVAITSSTNATPSVVTATAHGLTVGSRVLIYGHTVNTAINGIYKVTAATANTFTLGDEISGADVAANGVGGATGFCMVAPVVELSSDFKSINFSIITANSGSMTINFLISQGKLSNDSTSPRYDYPNMGATQSKTNPWSFSNFVDLATGNVTAGATGIVVAGTDINSNIEVNTNGIKYVTVIPTAWTVGALTVKMKAYFF